MWLVNQKSVNFEISSPKSADENCRPIAKSVNFDNKMQNEIQLFFDFEPAKTKENLKTARPAYETNESNQKWHGKIYYEAQYVNGNWFEE